MNLLRIPPHTALDQVHEPINEPVNATSEDRKEWFLAQLRKGESVVASDLARRFGIAPSTSKRDIAKLKKDELIEFVGAKKTGRYRLKK